MQKPETLSDHCPDQLERRADAATIRNLLQATEDAAEAAFLGMLAAIQASTPPGLRRTAGSGP